MCPVCYVNSFVLIPSTEAKTKIEKYDHFFSDFLFVLNFYPRLFIVDIDSKKIKNKKFKKIKNKEKRPDYEFQIYNILFYFLYFKYF